MRAQCAILMVAMLLAACAATAPAPEPSLALLDRADAQVRAERYREAMALYNEFMQRYGGTGGASRAEAGQALVNRLLASQADIDRLQREAAARDAELAQLRRGLAARQGELDRLRAEVARLRTDLERLRGVDLRRETPR